MSMTPTTTTTGSAPPPPPPPILSSSQALSTFCHDSQLTFCVAALRDDDSGRLAVTVFSSANGWAALGTGAAMAGSRMAVGWSSKSTMSTTSNESLVSLRRATGESLPLFDEGSDPLFVVSETHLPLSLVVMTNQVLSQPNIVFSFTVPLSDTRFISTKASSQFIYALSDTPPTTPEDPASSFSKHSLYGGLVLDVSTLGSTVTLSPSKIRVDLVFLHGILMFFAWGVIPPGAIFMARYLKESMNYWYHWHKYLFLFGVGALSIGGLVAVEMHKSEGASRFFTSNHGIIGTVVVFIGYPLQMLLGFISNALYDEERKSVPWYDQLHHWTGRIIMVLVLVQMQLGLDLYGASTGVIAAFWCWVVLILCCVFGFIGEYWLRVRLFSQNQAIELEERGQAPSESMEELTSRPVGEFRISD
ncbi:hypothetical protein HDU79_011332 [Rhizoclosmatium sp. JEL0117]|nr:hypothetical protein HDU79_011332 [Rhizoclosmatium sp. JEL0117]